MFQAKKILLIVNPVSGTLTVRQKLWQIINVFCKAGYVPTVMLTQKRGDAAEFAKNCPKDTEKIVCAGGDGTLNEVISGIMQSGGDHILGYIPTGTTNDLAESLGIKKDAVKAAIDIVEGSPSTIDVGCFGKRYFNYVASFGAFTDASYSATQAAKNVLGHFAYVLQGIASIGNIRPYNMSFKFDGEEISGKFIFGAVSNTTSMGGVLKIKDELVTFNDGLFELVLVKAPENISQFHQIINSLLSQNFSNELVRMYHTSDIFVSCDEDIDWTLDGEHQKGVKEAEIKNINNAVKIILPQGKDKI